MLLSTPSNALDEIRNQWRHLARESSPTLSNRINSISYLVEQTVRANPKAINTYDETKIVAMLRRRRKFASFVAHEISKIMLSDKYSRSKSVITKNC